MDGWIDRLVGWLVCCYFSFRFVYFFCSSAPICTEDMCIGEHSSARLMQSNNVKLHHHDLDGQSSSSLQPAHQQFRYTSQYSVPAPVRHSAYHSPLKRASSSNSEGLLGNVGNNERFGPAATSSSSRYSAKRRRASENVNIAHMDHHNNAQHQHHRGSMNSSGGEEFFTHNTGITSPSSSSLRGSNGNLGPWNGRFSFKNWHECPGKNCFP